MFGIVIAVIVAAWTVFISGNTMEAGFLSGMGFLWVWYWIWTVVIGVFITGMMLVVTGAMTFASADAMGSKVGGLLGFAGGGALSILVITTVMISRALLLGGTYLLMTSGTPEMSFADFNTNNLIFGTLLLVVGLVMSKSANSSSKDD
jgi:hypothetical protein